MASVNQAATDRGRVKPAWTTNNAGMASTGASHFISYSSRPASPSASSPVPMAAMM